LLCRIISHAEGYITVSHLMKGYGKKQRQDDDDQLIKAIEHSFLQRPAHHIQRISLR